MYVPAVPYVKVQATEQQRLEYAKANVERFRREEFGEDIAWIDGRAVLRCNRCHKGFAVTVGLCGDCYMKL